MYSLKEYIGSPFLPSFFFGAPPFLPSNTPFPSCHTYVSNTPFLPYNTPFL